MRFILQRGARYVSYFSLGTSPMLIYAARLRFLRVGPADWLHLVHLCVLTVPSPVAGKTIIQWSI